jgi:hypothetical protein
MPSYVPVIKNGASGAVFYVSLTSRSGTGSHLSNPTLAAGDVKISLDGGALANLATLPVVTPASSKLVKVTLSQAETNADNIVVLFSDAAGAEWCDLTVNLPTVSRQFDDLPTQAEIVAAILAAAVEAGLTVQQTLRLMSAVLLGKASGMATTTAVFRDTNDTKNRISATVDSSGNRTAVTLDAS